MSLVAERTTRTIRQSIMKVRRSNAVALLVELGLRNAGNPERYPLCRLEDKLQRINVDFEEFMVKDPDLSDLYGDIRDTVEDGGKVHVLPDEEDEILAVSTATKKGRKPDKAKKPEKVKKTKKADGSKAELTGKGKKKPRKVGVIATIVECLNKASAKKPVTKADILAVCIERFGPGTEADRKPESMRNTVAAQVPTGLRIEKPHLKVVKNEKGYWIMK